VNDTGSGKIAYTMMRTLTLSHSWFELVGCVKNSMNRKWRMTHAALSKCSRGRKNLMITVDNSISGF
jgi:hypothetical protein